MRMRQKHRGPAYVVSKELITQFAQSRSGVEYDALVTCRDLNTARISTKLYVIGRRASDAATNTPEIQANSHGYTQPITVRPGSLSLVYRIPPDGRPLSRGGRLFSHGSSSSLGGDFPRQLTIEAQPLYGTGHENGETSTKHVSSSSRIRLRWNARCRARVTTGRINGTGTGSFGRRVRTDGSYASAR